MKKLLFTLMAAVMIIATSCEKENADITMQQELSTITFNVGTPEIGTRAYSDGFTATQLQYAVYNAAGEILPALTVTDGTISGKTTVQLQLTTGNKYSVIFWAAAPNAPYTVDFANKTMTVNYSNAVCNDENRDAFFGSMEFTVTGAQTETVELRRPFAQLNIGAADYDASEKAGYVPAYSSIKVTNAYSTLNLVTGEVDNPTSVVFNSAPIKRDETFPVANNEYLAMSYFLVKTEKEVVDIEFTYGLTADDANAKLRTVGSVPVQRNYRTNIYGNLLTSLVDVNIEIKPAYVEDNKYGVTDGLVYLQVSTPAEFNAAFDDETVDIIILSNDVTLNEVITRSADPSMKIGKGKSLTIDLNGKTLSASSTQTGKNYNMIDVNGGTLTVKNGKITYKHTGENMGWSASTNIFNVTAGGVLNLDGVTATNQGGSDMGFVAHLNNWGEVTLNVDNCTLESNYIPVRVFNSGPDMNNVTIKNSTLTGKYAFWVHNYTVEDFGTAAKAEAQKALLNLSIYNQGNTFSPDVDGILYGFTNSVKSDARGITKVVSEDGTEVTLGTLVKNGVVRRNVAGEEKNNEVKKVIVSDGITELPNRTFYRYFALETVELPNTLTVLGSNGEDYYSNGSVFQGCSSLKNIVIPETVTTMGPGIFYGCTALESINIPAGITRIEKDAFRETGLVSVEFPESVTYFGNTAFRDCEAIKVITINASSFTVESNTFINASAPYPTLTINVANAEMKAYLESKLDNHQKTWITVVAPEVIDNTADLQAAVVEGKNVVLANDLTISASEMLTAPYGNMTALSHKGGVFNGNGKTISVTIGGDNYAVMTNGGTIKNLTIDNGFRGIMIMSPNQTVYLDNVVSSGEGVCYALNTGEGDSTQDLIATNCTFNGWSSWSEIKSATFTNCTFGQGAYYTNVSGRLGKPYVTTLFDGCEFGSKFYIDLSALKADQTVTLKNCTVNGVKLTAENWTSLVAPEDTCGEGQISIELRGGTFLTAENVADYIIFQ